MNEKKNAFQLDFNIGFAHGVNLLRCAIVTTLVQNHLENLDN